MYEPISLGIKLLVVFSGYLYSSKYTSEFAFFLWRISAQKTCVGFCHTCVLSMSQLQCNGHSMNGARTMCVFHSVSTLCDPKDCSLPDSSVHRILQASVLEWVGMSSSRRSTQPRDQTHVSYVTCLSRCILYP